MSKVVAIVSGGMDSVTLLYHLVKQKEDVLALSCDYGQRHKKEIEFARLHTQRLGVTHEVADLTGIQHLLTGSALTSPDVAVPHGHYADESMKLTVVPNRNAIMLSVAIGFAISRGADEVAYGAHAGDHAIYPDCRPEFAEAMDQVAKLADWHEVRLIRPFVNITKTDIAAIGRDLGIDYSETWSCYEGGDIHCGLCGTCVERIEAMYEAGMDDPTTYRELPA